MQHLGSHINLDRNSKEEIHIHTPQVPLFLLRQPQGFIQLVVSRIWVSRKKTPVFIRTLLGHQKLETVHILERVKYNLQGTLNNLYPCPRAVASTCTLLTNRDLIKFPQPWSKSNISLNMILWADCFSWTCILQPWSYHYFSYDNTVWFSLLRWSSHPSSPHS